MKDNNEINSSRRDLLKGLTTAAVAGAVVAGTKAATASETVDIKQESVKKTGYRETQHVRDYYDSL